MGRGFTGQGTGKGNGNVQGAPWKSRGRKEWGPAAGSQLGCWPGGEEGGRGGEACCDAGSGSSAREARRRPEGTPPLRNKK